MIDLKELRIGNWVKYAGTITPLQIDAYSFARVSELLEDYEPIELTDEILVKCGFKENVLLLGDKGVCSLGWHLISYTYRKTTTVNLGYDYDDCAYASHNSEHETELQYLHQLQNLVYLLTGSELEFVW